MHLHDQPACQAFLSDPALNGNHGQFDQIRGSALHGRVDGGTLGALPATLLSRFQIRQPQSTAEDSFDVAMVMR